MQPLEGITVVALEQAVAAPLATRHLADLGARIRTDGRRPVQPLRLAQSVETIADARRKSGGSPGCPRPVAHSRGCLRSKPRAQRGRTGVTWHRRITAKISQTDCLQPFRLRIILTDQ